MTTKGLLLASSALLFPWADAIVLAAFGVATVAFGIGFAREFGLPAISTDPTQCPACKRNDLLRVEAAVPVGPTPLLHCTNCRAAFRYYNGTFTRVP